MTALTQTTWPRLVPYSTPHTRDQIPAFFGF
ncbi:hypothetical protein FOIG_16882 [Fusarium odoratissimum NRRL 54006]|uniref:Uncharacterized protein n=1 Tax=Fusarium odoratissimum (strain NRRL 54006) TaxID=1089451 RepID=X0JYA9_FUSO5|nr:uncharacterized protein FOIG_16882 [Fusarium odoratissimum NRRL 54006]EXL89834.1 hypothetical protein FOIG_16882 [Fusarium odoratissimum NRRL 54006]